MADDIRACAALEPVRPRRAEEWDRLRRRRREFESGQVLLRPDDVGEVLDRAGDSVSLGDGHVGVSRPQVGWYLVGHTGESAALANHDSVLRQVDEGLHRV
jgi:hypothetical protein